MDGEERKFGWGKDGRAGRETLAPKEEKWDELDWPSDSHFPVWTKVADWSDVAMRKLKDEHMGAWTAPVVSGRGK